jgi:hypothetical protein
VLEVIELLQKSMENEDRAWGEVGAKLMMELLDPNEDWSSFDKGDHGRA